MVELYAHGPGYYFYEHRTVIARGINHFLINNSLTFWKFWNIFNLFKLFNLFMLLFLLFTIAVLYDSCSSILRFNVWNHYYFNIVCIRVWKNHLTEKVAITKKNRNINQMCTIHLWFHIHETGNTVKVSKIDYRYRRQDNQYIYIYISRFRQHVTKLKNCGY